MQKDYEIILAALRAPVQYKYMMTDKQVETGLTLAELLVSQFEGNVPRFKGVAIYGQGAARDEALDDTRLPYILVSLTGGSADTALYWKFAEPVERQGESASHFYHLIDALFFSLAQDVNAKVLLGLYAEYECLSAVKTFGVQHDPNYRSDTPATDMQHLGARWLDNLIAQTGRPRDPRAPGQTANRKYNF